MIVKDKVFVVTGAGGGIGGQLVLVLLNRGAKVIAVDLKEESLEQLKQQVGNQSVHLTTQSLDITDRAAIAKFAEQSNGVDALINNAGIIQPFVKVNDLEFKDIERVMNVNFYGTLGMTKAFLPQLLKRPEAYIANVSSMGGFLPVPGQSVYGASKAAVKLLTEGLYAELLNTNVHVSIIFPGATETRISENSGVILKGAENVKQKYTMLSPAKAAEIIIDGIEKNKPQIFTGKDSKSMNVLYRLNPVYATKLITKKMQSLLPG